MHSHDKTLLTRLGFADPDKKDSRHDLACQYLAQDEIALKLVDLVTQGEANCQRVALLGAEPEHHITKGSGQYQTTIGFADLVISYGALIDHEGLYSLAQLRLDAIQSTIQRLADEQRGAFRKYQTNQMQPYSDAYYRKITGDQPEKIAYEAKQQEQEEEKRGFEEALLLNLNKERERLGQQPPCWRPRRNGAWGDTATKAVYQGSVRRLLVEVKIGWVPTGDILRQIGLYRTYLEPDTTLLATAFDLTVEDVAMLKGEKVHHIRLGAAFDTYCQRRKEQPQMAASVEV